VVTLLLSIIGLAATPAVPFTIIIRSISCQIATKVSLLLCIVIIIISMGGDGARLWLATPATTTPKCMMVALAR
jgi:hypothetical protein